MPDPTSEWECDFIVLMHARRRLLISTSARVIAVYKRTKRIDRGVANIEEMAGHGDDVHATRRWVHENLEFTATGLAQVVFDGQLRQLT